MNRHGRGGFKWDEAEQGILLSSYSNGNILTLLLGGVVFTKGSPKNIAGKTNFLTILLYHHLLETLPLAGKFAQEFFFQIFWKLFGEIL